MLSFYHVLRIDILIGISDWNGKVHPHCIAIFLRMKLKHGSISNFIRIIWLIAQVSLRFINVFTLIELLWREIQHMIELSIFFIFVEFIFFII